MLVDSTSDSWYVLLSHWFQILSKGIIWQLMLLVELCLGYVIWFERKLYVNKLLRVQIAMPVLCDSKRCR